MSRQLDPAKLVEQILFLRYGLRLTQVEVGLEITPDEIDRAIPNPQLYSNPTSINNAQLNQLSLTKFQIWLTDRDIAYQPTFNDTESTTIWDVVAGCAILVPFA